MKRLLICLPLMLIAACSEPAAAPQSQSASTAATGAPATACLPMVGRWGSGNQGQPYLRVTLEDGVYMQYWITRGVQGQGQTSRSMAECKNGQLVVQGPNGGAAIFTPSDKPIDRLISFGGEVFHSNTMAGDF